MRRDGKFLGLLAATVRVDTLSELLEATAETLGGSAFILYDREFVLAHPKLVGGIAGLIPTGINQNPWAHFRRPIDMIFQG